MSVTPDAVVRVRRGPARARSVLHRATALSLSWVFTATTVWSAAPPTSVAGHAGTSAPLPSVVPGLAAALDASALVATDERQKGRDRDDRKDGDRDDQKDGDAKARPLLTCVLDEGGGRYTARFTYRNRTDRPITIPVGKDNRFSPAPENRGQPTVFKPGRPEDDPTRGFAVAFDGRELTWSVQGRDGGRKEATASRSSERCPRPRAPAPSCDVVFWGPKRFTRTGGAPNVYRDEISAPKSVTPPYVLRVVNGEPDADDRVSSARIQIDGTTVAESSDFSKKVPGFEREVGLRSTSRLEVTLESQPGSFLKLSFCGRRGDHTPPTLAWTQPSPGSTTNDRTPRLALSYDDRVGAGEPGASGVDPDSLAVELDGRDVTALFTKRAGDASALLPDRLALEDGLHALLARVRDRAGNVGQATSEFRVDGKPPRIDVVEPEGGAYLRPPVRVRVRYGDESGLVPDSLRVRVNGTDRTALFTRGAEEAVATLDLASGLREGGNPVEARIADRAGNEASDSIVFSVDVKAPVLVIGQPSPGSRHGGPDVEVMVQYHDDQALDLDSFAAEVDGVPVRLQRLPDGANGFVGPLADGAHRLVVRIRDRAGNAAAEESRFFVGKTLPTIQVVQPPPGGVIADATPPILVVFQDDDGVDTTTLRIRVNGVDRTALFDVGPEYASAELPPDAALPEGPNQVAAEIADTTGAVGAAVSDFVVDTVPPSVHVESLPAQTNDPRPLVTVEWVDTGSGVDPATARIRVDGVDRTALFAVGETGATGVLALDPPLADGEHEIAIEVKDRAGNDGQTTAAFTLDTKPPTPTVAAPAPDSFTNDTTPDLRFLYPDAGGTGVLPATVQVFLRRGTEPEAEVTGFLQIGAEEATGTIPDTAPLSDATYHLRLVVVDRAGNAAEAQSAFAVDTVAPTFTVESPAATQWLSTATPSFKVLYADDVSGVDTSRFAAAVDDVDRTERFAAGPDSATGTLLAQDALLEGAHTLAVKVFDRAGNAGTTTGPFPLTFSVDLTPPVVHVVLPVPGSYVGTPVDQARVEYADGGGSGIVPDSLQVAVDGTARPTTGWTLAADAASGPLVPAVVDGSHELQATIRDGAGNLGAAAAPFTVDSKPPVVALTSPDDGSFHKASPVTLTGTVEDADPQVAVECLRSGASAPATVTGGSFACSLPLAEGANAVRAEARDRLDRRTASDPRTLHLDTVAPEIVFTQPLPGAFVSGTAIDVRGEVRDASPILAVRVEGREAEVVGSQFTARGVPIGSGPEVTLHGEAEDAAGNVGRAPLPLSVDRESPQVTITRPVPDEHVKGPVIEVEGWVVDQSDVMVDVNGVPEDPPSSLRAPRAFRARVPVTETTTSVVATAIDAAGNPPGRHEVPIRVDSVPPVITLTSPAPGLVTKATSVLVAGTVQSTSPIVSLTVGGTPVPVSPDGSFQTEFPLPDETAYTIPVEATDAAGNTGTAVTTVVVDRTPPILQAHVPPAHQVVGAVPVTLEGTVVEPHLAVVTVDDQPATVTGTAWQATIGGLAEGGHAFVVRAEDTAGNASALSHPVTIDLSAPVVTLTSPAPGAVRDATTTVAGTVRDTSLESLAVNGSAVTWTGDPGSPAGATFAVPGFPLVDQQDNRVEAVALDQLQRSGSDAVTVFRDSLPPTLELQTPERLQRGQTGKAVAIPDDGAGLGVQRVVFWIDDQEKATLLAPPWELPLEVPDGTPSGTALKVTAQAWDLVDNASPRVSRGVMVVSQGVVVGRVLADETSLPLPGATVRLAAGSTTGVVTATTDETGGYSLPADTAAARIEVESPGRLTVQRELPVEAGVGSVPVDARLLTLAPPTLVSPTGGSVALGGPAPVTVTIPAGAVAADTDVRLTRLSSQGLPGLLPLGWSALVAFDLRADAPLQGPLPATAGGLPDGPVHLVQYRPSVQSWVMLDPGLAPASGTLPFALAGAGSYALAVTDAGDPPVGVPATGDPLTGVAMATIPSTATSTGVVEPPVLPPSGGSATGTLTLTSPAPLPSGTVVQAEVTETFSLASGEVASEEKRDHDIVLYRTPAASGGPTACQPAEPGAFALCAAFPITPSRSFETSELASGKVHLDILAGREGVRGKVGGTDAVRVETAGGEASVLVPALALPQNTAIAIETSALSSLLPATGAVPLAELVLDFSGQKLTLGAELSVASPGVPSDAVLVVARVERVEGVPRLAVASLASLVTDSAGDRLITVPYAGLPGVVEGGRYVFFRLPGPVGFVAGRTLQGAVGVRSVVESAGLPFIGLAGAGGSYVIAVTPGDVTLEARVPRSSLRGTSGPLLVPTAPAAPTPKDIALEGTVTVASVEPPDGTLDLPVTQQVEITSPTAIRPDTVTAESVRLFRVDGAALVPVPLRLQLSGSGRKLAVIPTSRLAFESSYKLESSGLVDVFGALLSVPDTGFTTRKEVPPASHPERLAFSFPDARGLVTVSGPGKGDAPPDGTFEAGTEILIINASNGVVLTLKAGNQNEVAPFEFPATINDRLMITVTDPFGNTTSFERSQFTNPETGETAVGPGGGVVQGTGGVELRIPTGAVDQGVVFKVAGLTPAELQAELGDDKVPEIPGAQLGSALRIEASAKPKFKKEVDLVFPLPAEAVAAARAEGKPAEDVFFYVHRRITDPRGAVLFQTLDWGQLECPGGAASCPDEEKKVVTSSFPFLGLVSSSGLLAVGVGGAAVLTAAVTAHVYLMWTFAALLPGQPTSGVVTGQVLRPEWPEGATVPVYKGVPGVPVWGKDASGLDLVLTPQPGAPPQTVAETDGGGRFTFFDNRFTTGTLEVKTSVDGVEYRATAYAVQLTDTKALANPAIAALARSLKFQQVATVDITVAPKVPPPPPPAVDVKVMRLVNGVREATDGVVVAQTPLLIGFRHTSNLDIASAEVDGHGLQIVPDNLVGTTAGSPLAADKLGLDVDAPDGTYTPKTAGRYSVKVVARPVVGDLTQTETFDATFLVVEGGEGNTAIREGEPPGVITARTLPLNGATEVPVETLPQVVFTEPVVNVPAGVFLEEIDAAGSVVETVPLGLVGVTPTGQVLQVVGPTDAVVSVTLKPLRGLKFRTTYQLRVTAAIMDKDTVPTALSPEHTSRFTTFGPKGLGGTTEQFVSPGLVVLGDHAYVLETTYTGGVATGAQNGFVRTFDISDPAQPVEVAEKEFVAFPPRDIAGESGTIAVVTSSRTFYRLTGSDLAPTRELVSTPGNLLLYDVGSVAPQWVGAASVATSLLDGFANRVVMDSGTAYVAMVRKGIQVVDIAAAKTAFESTSLFEVSKQMGTPGVGFGLGAVKTIPVLDPERPFTAALMDLKVKDLPWLGEPKRVILATGSSRSLGLVVADPSRLQELWRGAIQKADSVLDWGTALAPAVIEGQQLVLLGGYGKVDGGEAAGVVAIVDLTPMGARPPPGDPDPVPKVVRFIKLDHTVGDILISGTTAIVSGGQGAVGPDGSPGAASLIDLTNPLEARVVGTLSGVGSRLAVAGDGAILLSSERGFLTPTPSGLNGVRTAALGVAPLIKRPDVFAVNRNNRSLKPQELRLQIVPATTQVERAELELYEETSLSRTIPLPAFSGGNTTYTFPAGSFFNVDSRYDVRLVVNRGLGDREKASSRQRLRPARLDIIDTTDVELVPGKDRVDVVRMFHSAPQLTMAFKSFSSPVALPDGAGDLVKVNVDGTVSSAVAPIEKIVVNETVVQVSSTGTGTENRGPFTGRWAASVEVGPQVELVTAYAVDSLNHVSTQSLAVSPRERILGVIPGRDVSMLDPLVPGPTDAKPYEFRIELRDKGSIDTTAQIQVSTGAETKTIKLKKEGVLFVSEPLLALPETLKLPSMPPSVSDTVKATRLKVKLSESMLLKYGAVEHKAIASGINVVATAGVADWIDPGSGQGYVIEVGEPGTSGETLSVTVTSLGGRMESVAPGSSPTTQTFTLRKVGTEPELPSYNVYRAEGADALLALMDGIQTTAPGKRQRVLPFGRVKVALSASDLTLPVGAAADSVRWETLEVKPLYEKGIFDTLLTFVEGPVLPRWWRVTQSATFLRGNTAIKGLRVMGFLDRRTREVDEDSGITAVARQGDTWVPTTFPQLSDSEGKVHFQVEATAVDVGSTQPLAGVVLAFTDDVGIRAMNLLSTGGTTPQPLVADVSSEHQKEFKTTPIVAGYVSAGGIPRRHSEWYRRLSRLIVEQAFGQDPQIADIKNRLAAGLTAGGIVYTAEQLEEYFTYFILGVAVGIPRGAVGGFVDSVVGVYDLVGSAGPIAAFLAPKSEAELLLATVIPAPFGGAIAAKIVINAPYLAEQARRLKELLPVLAKAAEFLGREEIQAQLTVLLASKVLGNYQKELGKLVGYLGLEEGSPGFRPLVFGYSVGAVTGYLAEFGFEIGGASLVGEGVGALLPVMIKAGRLSGVGSGVVTALQAATRAALAEGNGSKLVRAFRFLIKLLDALGPNVLQRWMLRIAEIPQGPERVFAFLIKYGDELDGVVRLENIAKGLTGDVTAGAKGVENVVETLITIQKIALDAEYRGTRKLVVVGAEGAEDFAKALGKAVDLSKAEPELAGGFDKMFRNVDEVDEFFVLFAKEEDDALRGAARLLPCQ